METTIRLKFIPFGFKFEVDDSILATRGYSPQNNNHRYTGHI
ncbi:hypothetical protein OAE12_01355 [bacterium]|nr:hypothetical protein [bacterium]